MPRRGRPTRLPTQPDPKYNSELVSQLINKVMRDGKKSVAQKLVYDAFEIAEERLNTPALEIFEQALDNVRPVVEVRPRRVGGSTYQVPMEVRPERRVSLGLRWMVQAARSRGSRTFVENLANEIMDAYNRTGAAVRKREEVHRMAEANKAYSHFRW